MKYYRKVARVVTLSSAALSFVFTQLAIFVTTPILHRQLVSEAFCFGLIAWLNAIAWIGADE